MKNYNKLPFKERKRHLEYQFNQTERQEEILVKRMIKEKKAANRSQEPTSEKERETNEQMAMNEQMARILEIAKGNKD